MIKVDNSYSLGWDEVAPVAPDAFGKWTHGRELLWAEVAWNKLAQQGLTTFVDELDRCRVAARFVALALIYNDWSGIVDEEYDELDLATLAGEIEINAFRLGQLIGASKTLNSVYEESELVERAIAHLADVERPTVAKALLTGFGSEESLFLSLWRINYPAPSQDEGNDKTGTCDGQMSLFPMDEVDGGGEENLSETDEQVLNGASSQKIRGFEWISDRMPIWRQVFSYQVLGS